MMKAPRSLRISSAGGVSGALAPSAIIFARMRPAFFSVMAEPPAAGIKHVAIGFEHGVERRRPRRRQILSRRRCS